MAAPKRPPTKAIAHRLKIAGAVAAGLGMVVVCAYGVLTSDDSVVVPAPTGEMRAETTAQLAKATAAQGICYGWWLEDGRTGADLSRGSNLGAGAPVDLVPDTCPRWVEVRATVTYTEETSESEDFATVLLAASNGLAAPDATHLGQLGFTESAFVDDPAWAICEAALALPLLMAESGLASPAPLPAPQAGAVAAPDDAGSDFWRDRWWQVLTASLLILAGALMFGIGWFQRKHEKSRVAS
ncbi:hypothetical protein WEI85_08950 [Actinomycetes bacterium KLBMP 9797]